MRFDALRDGPGRGTHAARELTLRRASFLAFLSFAGFCYVLRAVVRPLQGVEA